MKTCSLFQVSALISLVASGIFPAHHAQADDVLGFISGNQLLQMCQSASDFDKATCVGYVTGFADSASKVSATDNTCVFQTEKGVTQKQVVDIAVKYLVDHPEERHWLAATPLMAAMKQAFPCGA